MVTVPREAAREGVPNSIPSMESAQESKRIEVPGLLFDLEFPIS